MVEFATALKPYFLKYLLEKVGVAKLLYLDPDIAVTASRWRRCSSSHAADYLLTPHLDTDYPADGASPSLQMPLLFGAFNLGFLGVRNSPGALRMLTWLEEKLHGHCIGAPDRGYFVDQKFFDVAITLFRGVHIERDPAYNVGPWSLHSRTVSRRPESGVWLCNDRPLSFYHFSNYRVSEPDRIAGTSTGTP